jgi:hypothetical protein
MWQFTSTAQLRNPGRRYEVSDELESYFFVLFYMALHWVIHNKPDMLDVGRIFDDARVLPNGISMGGEGKLNMYIPDGDAVLKHLTFTESPLLTNLVRKLFRFFQSLAHFNCDRIPAPQDVENAGKLKNYKAIRTLVKDAAKRDDWPVVCDKAATDIYPCQEGIDAMDCKGKADSSLGSISTLFSAGSGESRGSKREREEEEVLESSKRPKKKP